MLTNKRQTKRKKYFLLIAIDDENTKHGTFLPNQK